MRLDQTQRGWAQATLALLAVSGTAYAVYAGQAPAGPRGGSPMGLAFGVLATRTSTGVDARAFVAGPAELADDPVSRRIPFRRDANTRADVAADYHGGERSVRGRAAELHTADDDIGNSRKGRRETAQLKDRQNRTLRRGDFSNHS